MLRHFFIAGVLSLLSAVSCGYLCCGLLADETSAAKKAALGAETRAPSADEADTNQLNKLMGKPQGQYVRSVDKDGPAEKAGLQVGDLLLALNANKVFSRDDIEDFLRVSQPGSKVDVLVKRAGTSKEGTVLITLRATEVEDQGKHFTWQYAGLGQLDAARAAAKTSGKRVLVGLSGAET